MVFITETFVCDFTNLNDIEKAKKSPLRKFCLGYDKTNFYLVDTWFCRAMLCISAAYAVMRCLSVRPSVCLCVCHVRGSCQNE